MEADVLIMVAVFAATAGLALVAGLVFSGRERRLSSRLDQLSGRGRPAAKTPETVGEMARATLPKLGKVITPDNEVELNRLTARLTRAGLYNRQAMHIFLGVKLSLLLLAFASGLGLTLSGIAPAFHAMSLSLGLFLAGMIGPGFWLDHRKKKRQLGLRRAMPDALDVLIICLEGGLSFQSALKRVAEEIRSAHPILGYEFRIVDREVQLGRSPGEALLHFAQRTDLDEARSLSTVIGQSERFGASLVKSLRNHSETLRVRRRQIAEEQAQKAATKILFPTLFCIFPAIFVILLGPAVYQVSQALGGDGQIGSGKPAASSSRR